MHWGIEVMVFLGTGKTCVALTWGVSRKESQVRERWDLVYVFK